MKSFLKEGTPHDITSQLLQRFVEFYRFSHRNFIYDAVGHNESVMQLLAATESGPWVNRPELHLPISVLNNGDCFIAALAVGEALKTMGYNVTYYANGGHYFFSIKYHVTKVYYEGEGGIYDFFDIYFDTIYPEGKRSPEEMLRHHNPQIYKLESGDGAWLVERALEDAIDIEFIEQFVRFYCFDYSFPYAVPNTVGTDQWFYRNCNGAT